MARMEGDAKDLQCIINYSCERKPFIRDIEGIRSLSTGLIAETSVNVNTTELVGTAILESMEGRSVFKHKFSKRTKSVLLHLLHKYVSVEGEKLAIDPQHLYQRLWQELQP